MLLWCGLNGKVVSTSDEPALLEEYADEIRKIEQCRWLADQVKPEGKPSAPADEGVRDLVTRALRAYPSLPAQQRRRESAGICTVHLPQNWSAVLSGVDLVGVSEEDDPIDVALFPPAGAPPAERYSQLAEFKFQLETLLNLSGRGFLRVFEGGILIIPTDSTAAAPGASPAEQPQPVALVTRPFDGVSEADLARAVARFEAVGVTSAVTDVTCDGVAGKGILFGDGASAAYAVTLGVGRELNVQFAFESPPASVLRQPIALTFAEDLSMTLPCYRFSVLLSRYLGHDPALLLTARLALRWFHWQKVSYNGIPKEAGLLFLCYTLIVAQLRPFVPPTSISAGNTQPETVAPPVHICESTPEGNAARETVTRLLLEYFRHLATFDYGALALSLHTPALTLRKADHEALQASKETRLTLLGPTDRHVHVSMCVIDPFTGTNLTASVSKLALCHFKGAAAAMVAILESEELPVAVVKDHLAGAFGYAGRKASFLSSFWADFDVSVLAPGEEAEAVPEVIFDVIAENGKGDWSTGETPVGTAAGGPGFDTTGDAEEDSFSLSRLVDRGCESLRKEPSMQSGTTGDAGPSMSPKVPEASGKAESPRAASPSYHGPRLVERREDGSNSFNEQSIGELLRKHSLWHTSDAESDAEDQASPAKPEAPSAGAPASPTYASGAPRLRHRNRSSLVGVPGGVFFV
ncbi:hypothetical protein DIPPA_22588 [Diplonema papillatum]|nr:hypothetical protein DIPPA_22588 [Diplonema papillatum]